MIPEDGIPSESPFLQMIGTRIFEWRDGETLVRVALKPHLLNRSGVVQGGVLASLLDHAAGLAGLWCSIQGNKRYGMTVSLNVQYIGQAKAGTLIATGRRTGGGRSMFFSDSEVRTEGGVLLAKGAAYSSIARAARASRGRPNCPGRCRTMAEA